MDDLEKEVDFLYKAKLSTGKYDHYNKEQLALLYLDCVMQAQAMSATFGA